MNTFDNILVTVPINRIFIFTDRKIYKHTLVIIHINMMPVKNHFHKAVIEKLAK